MRYMKWTDLEPGDKLKWTKEALEKFKEDFWVKHKNKILEILKIDFNGSNGLMRLYFDEKDYEYIDAFYGVWIDKLNGSWNGIQLFEIVNLKED